MASTDDVALAKILHAFTLEIEDIIFCFSSYVQDCANIEQVEVKENQVIIEKQSKLDKYGAIVFFALAYLIGFIFVVLPVSTGIQPLILVAAISSSLSGIITVSLTRGKQGLKDPLGQFKNWRSHPKRYIFAIVFPLFVVLVSSIIALFFGNPFPLADPMVWLNFLVIFPIYTIQAGLGEEIGQRGHATPKLNEKFSALVSSLIVGTVWAFWHLALFFVPGSAQYIWGQYIGVIPTFIVYAISVIGFAVIQAWLYQKTNSNLWMPVLMHGAINTFGGTLTPSLELLLTTNIFWFVVAIIIVIIYDEHFKKRTFRQ